MPLNIVFSFGQCLRRCMPCDAQTFIQLPADTPIHHEVFALLLKEPWLVDLFRSICLEHLKKEPDARHRVGPKQSDQYLISIRKRKLNSDESSRSLC